MQTRLLALLLSSLLTVPAVIAQPDAVLWFENFDAAGSLDDLHGWSFGHGWILSSATPSSGSGRQSIEVRGNAEGAAETPIFDLRRLKDGELRYLTRRTGSFPDNGVRVLASIDGGLTYPYVVADTGSTLGSGGSWRQMNLPLPPEVVGSETARFMFESTVSLTASPTVRFDDIAVGGEPYFYVEPPSGLFAAEPGDVEVQTLTLYNNTSDALSVAAADLTGHFFSIDPTGPVVVPVGASQEYIITFAPEEEGTYPGEIIFSSGTVGLLTVPIVGLTAPNVVSFTQTGSVAGETAVGHEVGISLGYSNEEANLQGLQMSISWDDDVAGIASIEKGIPVLGDEWTVSFNIVDQSATILLFDNSGMGLPVGHHPDLITLLVDTDILYDGEREATFTIDEVIGALAVPTADDAQLIIRLGEHQLRVEHRSANLEVNVDALDFGMLDIGQTLTETFWLLNPGGERPFTVADLTFGEGPLTVDPASATINPNDTVVFTVTFAPTETEFGMRDSPLRIAHNAEPNGVFDLPVRAIGIWGRGDNDGDGMVDAMDIVNTTDFILGRENPTSRQMSRSDLYPFEDGDGELDIRDLSVTVQAIVRDEWPDGVSLPATYDLPPDDAGKQLAMPVLISISDAAPDLLLELETAEPLRALQLHFQIEDIAEMPRLILNQAGAPTASAQVTSDEDGNVRILLYRPDGGVVEPGTYRFARIQRSRGGGFITREYATAIGGTKQRLPVDVEGLVATPTERISPAGFEVGSPYPNPIRSGSTLRVSLRGMPESGGIRLEVFDLLGRRVDQRDIPSSHASALEWDVRSTHGGTMSPGVYLLRISNGDYATTRKIVVVR